MPDKVRRPKCKLPAIDCAYQAILKIGFIDWRFYGEHGPALERCQEISNNALRHLNSAEICIQVKGEVGMSNEKQREPEVNSRSQQKRIAAMKGGPAPTFEAAAEPAQPVPPKMSAEDFWYANKKKQLWELDERVDMYEFAEMYATYIASAPSPVLTPLGICDNNSLLHPRADKHEQMETCENWRPCAPVLTQPSAAWINEFLREHCTGMDDHDDPHEECAKCQHMRMQLNYQLGAERPVLPVPPRAHDDTVDLLQNLLAVIHRDGGHYVTEHGIEKAAEDAEKIVVSMRASRNEILQEALDACEQFDRTVEVRKCMDKIRALQVAAQPEKEIVLDPHNLTHQVVDVVISAVAPADTPVCSKCKTRLKYFGNEIEPCVNCCKAVAGRTQGDWEDWRGQLLDAWRHDHRATMNALLEGGPAPRESASPMNGTEMLDSILGTLLSRAEGVNTGGDINIMKTVDRIVKRESAREAHSDDLIEALKTIADAPTHITYEGIFVSTNVKDIARKALNREKQPPNEK